MTNHSGRIVQGDCIEKLQSLDPESVDLAFADPPFNIGYDYDEYDDRRSSDDYLDWSRRWMGLVLRALKPDGTFWLAIGDEYAAELKVLATHELGLICRSWVVWYYTFGVHCVNKFTRSHAHLFYFVKNAKKFTFNADAVRVPSARQLVYGDRRANPKGRMPDDTWIIAPGVKTSKRQNVEKSKSRKVETSKRESVETAELQNRDRKGTLGVTAPRPVAQHGVGDGNKSTIENPQSPIRNPQSPIPNPQSAIPNPQSAIRNGWILRPQDLPNGFSADGDTWYFPRVCGTFKERTGFHGCQMPEQLLGRIIRACSNEGDLVLDPFSGSGTTLAVAKKLNRRYLGIEISKQYVTESRARLARTKPGDPLDGAEDPLTSVVPTTEGIIRTADGKRIKRNSRTTHRKPHGRAQFDQPHLWDQPR